MSLRDFNSILSSHGIGALRRCATRTLQLNVGRLCNQACHHCHVDAGPTRSEIMPAAVADRVLELLAASPAVTTLDLTGGAPELNPHFRRLVSEARRLERRVIDRCNLTVLLEPRMETTAEFLAAHQVEIAASLPCYSAETVDGQRGHGVFQKSINALRLLNSLGYGQPGSPLRLDLVYNPSGPALPPSEAALEAIYKRDLRERHGIEFHRLLTITNMPIKRFAASLRRAHQFESYNRLLAEHFNADTLDALMCRSLLSVAWDGRLYDCDFNQMLELPLGGRDTPAPRTIWDLDSIDDLNGQSIATARHCFGCTAGRGSSCSGSLRVMPETNLAQGAPAL